MKYYSYIFLFFIFTISSQALILEDNINISNNITNIEIDNYDDILTDDDLVIASHSFIIDDVNISFSREYVDDVSLELIMYTPLMYDVKGDFNLVHYVVSNDKHFFYDGFETFNSFTAIDSFRSLILTDEFKY